MNLSKPAGQSDLATVADELAILRVLAWNYQSITEGNVDAYVSTFTEDAHVVWWDGESHGEAAIRAYFVGQQGRMKVRDSLVNIVVDIQGNTACAIGTGIVVPSERPPVTILAQATVTSHLVKDTAGVWRIRFQSKVADASFDITALSG